MPNEDLQLGACCSLLGIPLQSSQQGGRSSQLPYLLSRHLAPAPPVPEGGTGPGPPAWWLDRYPSPPRLLTTSPCRTGECGGGPDCVSPSLVSAHYVSPASLYTLQYWVYGFRLAGRDIQSEHITSPKAK